MNHIKEHYFSGYQGKLSLSELQLNIKDLEGRLLAWYDVHQRHLPWRAVPRHTPNPYNVWLSEIMLQQTTVATVKDYFINFVTRWPTIEALSKASLDEVFHAWQGLGYYSRARNLHRCAQVLKNDYKGNIPQIEEELLTLPGVGPYTAAAIAAIAFDQPTVPVDGNIVRVFARLFSLKKPLPAVKEEVLALAKQLIPTKRSGDFAQGLMDLGATVCRPKNPSCDICPLQSICVGYSKGIADQLPFPAIKAVKPRRYGIAFWVENSSGEILLEKRPDKGLLAGLMGLPTTEWRDMPWDGLCEEALSYAPKGAQNWEPLSGVVRHTFTHFHLELSIFKGKTVKPVSGIWSSVENLKDYALPTVMKKVIRIPLINQAAST
jgi:A/G-specific adenine glycosylase